MVTGLQEGAPAIPSAEGNSFGDPAQSNVISFDLSTVSSGGPSVPEGTYLAQVKSAQPQRSKSSGNPMLVVEYAIVEGEYAGKVPGKSYMSFTEAALFKLKEFAEATGLIQEDETVSFTPEEAIGRLVTLEVIHTESTQDGKTRTWANPGSVSPPPQGAGAVYSAPSEGIPT